MNKSLFFVFLVFVTNITLGQQSGDNLDTETISIVRPYDPSVSDVYKLFDYPVIQDTTTEQLKLKYNITSKPIQTTFEINPIKPAKISRSVHSELYRFYVKGGMGNYTTPYLEIFANNARSVKKLYGIHLKHLSLNKKAQEESFSQYSNNYIGLYGKRFWDNKTFASNFIYERDAIHFLGGDFLDNVDTIKEWKRVFHTLESNIKLSSNKLKSKSLFDNVSLQHYFYKTNTNLEENLLHLNSTSSTPVANELFQINFSLQYIKSNAFPIENNTPIKEYTKQNRLIINLVPSLITNKGKFNAIIGLNSYIDLNYITGDEIYFYPKADFSYIIVPDILTTYFSINGELESNSFKDILSINPYLETDLFMHQEAKAIKTTDNNIIIQGGLNGAISSKATFNISSTYKKSNNSPLFKSDSTDVLTLIYKNLNIVNVSGDIAFIPNKKWGLNMKASFNKYKTKEEEKAWNLPALKTDLHLYYKIKEKFLLSSTTYYVSKRYSGLEENHTLPSYVDMNLSIQYEYSPLLSIFFNINNLFHDDYERWYGYPTQGLNILGGFSYRF